jgi:hypothetical protein
MQHRHTAIMGVLALSWAVATGCQAGPDDEGHRPDGSVLQHRFPSVQVGPYEETDALCQSWTLHNAEPIHVNAVAMTNETGFHHSNWFFVPESEFDGPDGTWSCADRGWDQLEAAIKGGVVFAGSVQVTEEVQAFPPGAVYAIPPRSRIVGNLHILNAGSSPLETSISMELRTIPEDQVTVRLSAMALAYEDLAIPARSRSRFESSCDFAAAYGAPLDFNFYYVLPHYHSRGYSALFEAHGGPGGPREILEQQGRVGDVLGQTLDPPLGASGATHLRFGCQFANDGDSEVGWGDGDAEMCIVVAWQDSGYTWLGAVLDRSRPAGADEDGVQTFEGPCQITFVPSRF